MNIIRTQWEGEAVANTHSAPRCAQGGWSLGKGLAAIPAQVGVA